MGDVNEFFDLAKDMGWVEAAKVSDLTNDQIDRIVAAGQYLAQSYLERERDQHANNSVMYWIARLEGRMRGVFDGMDLLANGQKIIAEHVGASVPDRHAGEGPNPEPGMKCSPQSLSQCRQGSPDRRLTVVSDPPEPA